jgi:hypothetical protein
MLSRIIVTNLFTGLVLEELAFDQFQYTRTKNVPGGWSATMSHQDRKLSITPSLLEPWTRGIYLDYDGVILAGGILMPKHIDPLSTAGATLEIGGEGFFSYYREGRRSIRSIDGMRYAWAPSRYEVRFDQVDQFLIVQDFFAHAAAWVALGGSQGNIGWDAVRFYGPGVGGVGVPAGLTGLLRDRSYFTYEYKGIGEAIEDLSAVIDGFEFSESYAWAGGNKINRYFDLWYPEKGIEAEPVDLQFGLRKLSQEKDPKGFATRTIATGAGDKDAKLEAYAFDFEQEFPIGSYPALEKVVSYTDVIVPATLQGHADRDLAVSKIIQQTLDVEFLPVGDFVPGAIDWGMSLDVYVDDGDLQINDSYRIESISATIDRESQVTLTGTLALEAQSCPMEAE